VVGIDELSKQDNFLSIYPVPAHETCTINYTLTAPANVSVSIMDIVGRHVKDATYGIRGAGGQSDVIDLSGLPKGAYFLKLTYGENAAVKKIIID